MNVDFFNEQLWGNSVRNYLTFVASFFIFLALFKIFQAIIINRLKKIAERTKTDIDDIVIKIFEQIKPPFYFFLSLYLGLFFLSVSITFRKALNVVLIILVVYQVAVAIQVLINFLARKTIQKEGEGEKGVVNIISLFAKITVWSLGLLLVLSNIGIDITALIAGLGIGGIAIALALRNILIDLFSSFAIHFDKPFVVGDFIVVGEHTGTVEKIGIKTSRLRSVQGEEIIISNKELTSARIRNFKRMKERKVIIKIGTVYETPQAKLKNIPSLLQKIVDAIPDARFDRAHFKSFNDSSLGFELAYFVESKDYLEYMNINQEVHFKITEEFEKEKISMAYPTKTIYMKK